MTRFGIGRRIGKLATEAAQHCPSLQGRKITPHVFRHTIALHLIESNADLELVREWLGHADLKTTSRYLEVSVERKRAALERIPPPASCDHPEKEPQAGRRWEDRLYSNQQERLSPASKRSASIPPSQEYQCKAWPGRSPAAPGHACPDYGHAGKQAPLRTGTTTHQSPGKNSSMLRESSGVSHFDATNPGD